MNSLIVFIRQCYKWHPMWSDSALYKTAKLSSHTSVQLLPKEEPLLCFSSAPNLFLLSLVYIKMFVPVFIAISQHLHHPFTYIKNMFQKMGILKTELKVGTFENVVVSYRCRRLKQFLWLRLSLRLSRMTPP